MPTIIHINTLVVRSNAKTGASVPPVTVTTPDGVLRRCMEVDICGPSRVRYSPGEPLENGAKCWIETEAEVVLVGAG